MMNSRIIFSSDKKVIKHTKKETDRHLKKRFAKTDGLSVLVTGWSYVQKTRDYITSLIKKSNVIVNKFLFKTIAHLIGKNSGGIMMGMLFISAIISLSSGE
jgi:hypothetical protein